jgi:hypothetical protein
MKGVSMRFRKNILISIGFILLLAACQSDQIEATTPTANPPQTNANIPSNATIPPSETIAPTDTQTSVPTDTHAIPTDTPISMMSATFTDTTQPVVTQKPVEGQSKAIIVDHQSVNLFDEIPDEYLEAARNMKVVFSNRSVGHNINQALDCLTAPSWAATPSYCRRDYFDPNWNWKTYTGGAPARISFNPNPIKYDRSNWFFEYKQGEWSALTQDFIEVLTPSFAGAYDVLSYKFPYFAVDQNTGITDPETGFFANSDKNYDIYDLEKLYAQYPDKIFVLWTTSLSRSIGNQVSEDFNNQMREYVLQNNKFLFDIADIESHTDQGVPCYDNRDGVEYCSQNGECENYPDDGIDLLAICQDYTTEINGGHLGSVSAGKIQLAKGFWVLMARVAGWNP